VRSQADHDQVCMAAGRILQATKRGARNMGGWVSVGGSGLRPRPAGRFTCWWWWPPRLPPARPPVALAAAAARCRWLVCRQRVAYSCSCCWCWLPRAHSHGARQARDLTARWRVRGGRREVTGRGRVAYRTCRIPRSPRHHGMAASASPVPEAP
jgi:hypothetical protein